MFKKLSLPLVAVLAFQFTFAPVASAVAYNKELYKDVLSDIYKKSELGDGGDIYRLIKKALEQNPTEGTKLVDALISELEDNLDDLAFDVSKEDLRRIKKQLKRYLQRRSAFVSTGGSTNQGNVAPPESNTVNN